MPWDRIEKRPARNPFALAHIETRQVPCIVTGWERGHGDMPHEWHARVLYWTGDKPMESLIPAPRVKGVGADDPAVQLYLRHFAPRE